MGKVFMWIGIVLGSLLVLLFLFSTLMPQSMADLFMSFAATSFDIKWKGEEHTIEFSTLGDGVEPEDRLFLMKKMVAFHVLAEYEREYRDDLDAFNEALIAASADKTLSSAEMLDLKMMYADILPDERVNHWIDMAKELEEHHEEMERGTGEQ